VEKSDLIKQANSKKSLLSVFKRYGINITRRSQDSVWSESIVCPLRIHKNGRERTPSFGYNFKQDFFNCFGCGSSGGVVEFLAIQTKLSREDIAKNIIDEAGGYDADFIVEDFNQQIEETLNSFSIYIGELVQKHKDDPNILKQIDKLNEWFDSFMYFKAKKEFHPSDLQSTIAIVKEYLEPYE